MRMLLTKIRNKKTLYAMENQSKCLKKWSIKDMETTVAMLFHSNQFRLPKKPRII